MKDQEVNVTITAYSKKGHGLAFLEESQGKVRRQVEIVSGVIGDRLKVVLSRRRKPFLKGTLLEILVPSKDRVPPRCCHARVCGGCTFQEVAYSAQIAYKEKSVKTLFMPFLKKGLFHSILFAPNPWHYRNKMEFSFSQNKDKEKFLGLMMTHSKGKVLNLETCFLASSWFVEVLKACRSWWQTNDLTAYHPPSGRGCLRTLTLREGKRTHQKMIILTISGNHEDFLQGIHLKTFTKTVLALFPKENPSLFLRIQHTEKNQPTRFYEMHLHGEGLLKEFLSIKKRFYTFYLSPASFFQPHPFQAEKLYEKALELAELNPSMRVYDLYAGGAVLGILVASYVRKVISIEICPSAICDARVNIEANHVSNLHLIQGDVEEVLKEFQLSADLVILDPPRTGLGRKVIVELLRLKPKKILYISCNPFTQKEDIERLIKGGFYLKDFIPIDQFPHTPHLETLALLCSL